MDDRSIKGNGTEDIARGTGRAAHIPQRKECAVYGQYLSVCPHSGGRNHNRQTKSIKRSDKRPIDIE